MEKISATDASFGFFYNLFMFYVGVSFIFLHLCLVEENVELLVLACLKLYWKKMIMFQRRFVPPFLLLLFFSYLSELSIFFHMTRTSNYITVFTNFIAVFKSLAACSACTPDLLTADEIFKLLWWYSFHKRWWILSRLGRAGGNKNSRD